MVMRLGEYLWMHMIMTGWLFTFVDMADSFGNIFASAPHLPTHRGSLEITQNPVTENSGCTQTKQLKQLCTMHSLGESTNY